jgi:hypothetical protein
LVASGKTSCPDCSKEFLHARYLPEHRQNCPARKHLPQIDVQNRTCPHCQKIFSVRKNMLAHVKTSCSVTRTRLPSTNVNVAPIVKPATTVPKITINPFEARQRHSEGVWESQSACNSMLTNYTIENIEEIHDPKVFLESKRSIARDLIKKTSD